jgi:hypothetical protein
MRPRIPKKLAAGTLPIGAFARQAVVTVRLTALHQSSREHAHVRLLCDDLPLLDALPNRNND